MSDIPIGTKIKSLRIMRDMFQGDLSKQSGISRQTLISIERGDVTPSQDTLAKLERVFGVDFNSIQTRTAFNTLAGS